ncbi:BON domain-containing protein [Phenylobacterium sp.]|uniref:BON domain-containing protein n=1 Tax=Phenylobacterium sp. TaxID=1871053 RepID=UPI002FDA211C
MADWMDEQDRRMRMRDWRRADGPGHGGDFGRSSESRSFSPDEGYGGRTVSSYGQAQGERGRGDVFGERETGAQYDHSTRGYGRDQGRTETRGDRAYGFDGAKPGDQDRIYGEGHFGPEGYAMEAGGFGGRPEPYDRGGWNRTPREEAYERAYGGVRRGRLARSSERDYDRDHDRGFWDRASDEVASWFGDRDAERRREQDEVRNHRGRGPKGYVRSDERIADEVHHRLTDDSWLDASDIEVAVREGEVTLTGFVEDRFAKHRAEHCVEDILGVKHVQNNLRIQARVDRASVTGEPAPLSRNSVLAKATDGEL